MRIGEVPFETRCRVYGAGLSWEGADLHGVREVGRMLGVRNQRISFTSSPFAPFCSFNPFYPCSVIFYVIISQVWPQEGTQKGAGKQFIIPTGPRESH